MHRRLGGPPDLHEVGDGDDPRRDEAAARAGDDGSAGHRPRRPDRRQGELAVGDGLRGLGDDTQGGRYSMLGEKLLRLKLHQVHESDHSFSSANSAGEIPLGTLDLRAGSGEAG